MHGKGIERALVHDHEAFLQVLALLAFVAGVFERQAEERPMRRHLREQHRVERLADLWSDVEQHVAEEDAAGHERQRHRHINHSALAGHVARLAQDGQAVAHRLNSSVGAATEAVGAQKHQCEC